MKSRIGVCSWSLQPESPRDLVEKVAACGVRGVQLALDPVRDGKWDESDTLEACQGTGIEILSGMMGTVGEDYSTLETIRETGGVRPDAHWESNLTASIQNAAVAKRLGLGLVTLHAGFMPHDPSDPERALLRDRLRAVADAFAAEGVAVGLETGQESAATLAEMLDELDRENVGVNFDPANMILYGMGDPVASLRLLAPHVRQIHIKDATPTRQPGTWGTEVAAGEGAVDWRGFFDAYRAAGLACDLVIEREAGEQRVEDVRVAHDLVERLREGDA